MEVHQLPIEDAPSALAPGGRDAKVPVHGARAAGAPYYEGAELRRGWLPSAVVEEAQRDLGAAAPSSAAQSVLGDDSRSTVRGGSIKSAATMVHGQIDEGVQ